MDAELQHSGSSRAVRRSFKFANGGHVVWGCGYVTGDIFVRMSLAGLGLTEKPK